MANQTDRIKNGLLKNILREMKGANEKFEKVAQAEMDAAAEGKGSIAGGFARLGARQRIAKEYMMATKGTLNRRRAIFEGMGLENAGALLETFFPGKKEEASPELLKKFGLDKKSEKESRGGIGKLAKPLSLILRNVIETKKMVKTIEKSMAKASAPSGKYTFDPRMAGGGRFRDTETNKLVSSKVALKERTSALTSAIYADEQPLVQLKENLDLRFEELNASMKNIKMIKDTADSIKFSIDGIIPRVADLSVHSKLDLLLKASAMDAVDDVDLPDGKNRPRNKPTRPGGAWKKIRGGLGRAARFTLGAGAQAATAVGAVALIGGGTAYMASGKAADEAKKPLKELERIYGLKVLYDSKGATVGYTVNGKKYGLDDLPQEYKDLIEAYGPGDKRNASARAAIERIKANPEKYKMLELGYKKPKPAELKIAEPSMLPAPTVAVKAPSISTAPTGATKAPAAAAMPTSPVVTAVSAVKSTVSGAVSGGQTKTAAQTAANDPERRLGTAAAQRGKISAAEGKNAALAAAAKAGITGSHLAQFMAQLDHESNGFTSVEENLRYSAKRLLQIFPKYYKDPAQAEADAYSPMAIANRVYANRMGNGPPESGDGYRYRGRGLIQLTGKDNYKRFGQMAGIDLVSNPDLAGNLGTAADIAAAFYKKNVIDKGISGDNTTKVTKAINGGTIGLSHRESLFASYSRNSDSLKSIQSAPDASGAMLASTAPAPSVSPAPKTSGVEATQQSRQYDTNKMVASAAPAPAPVVINNNTGSNKMPPQAPKQALPMASTRPSENTFNRATSRDFNHPTSFTSTVVG